MDWMKIVGIGAGFFAIAVPAARFLISSYFKKAEELEKQKAANVKSLLDSLRRDIDNLGTISRSVRDRMVDLEKQMIKTQNCIKNNDVQINAITRLLDSALDTAKNISDNMEDKVQSHVRSEVLKLKEHLIMIRSKQEGANGK